MKILCLSRYTRMGSSSRIRFYQFFPYLQSRSIDIIVEPLLDDGYLRGLYTGRIPYPGVLMAYWKRLTKILMASSFDLLWIEKELLPWLPSVVELGLLPKAMPIVVDYDDAVFHRYDRHRLHLVRWFLGKKIDHVMRRANVVIVGNHYLSLRAQSAGARHIYILPSVVDINRYKVVEKESSQPLTIGWIGAPVNTHYLRLVWPALSAVVERFGARIVAVGANPEQVSDLPVDVQPWSEETEVAAITNFDIGIMPLPDEPFERGKCGYKLIQYMACGRPVVASPVGVNSDIVRDGKDGFLAKTADDWINALSRLCLDADLRLRMGAAGRARTEAEYSLQVHAPRLERILSSVM